MTDTKKKKSILLFFLGEGNFWKLYFKNGHENFNFKSQTNVALPQASNEVCCFSVVI